jgi:hypothetical protein
MRVRYTGESTTGVNVVHPDPDMPGANTVTRCPPGEPVDLPDDIALQQMAVGVFEPADPAAEMALRQHTDMQVDVPARPSPGASKDHWIAYAVDQGWTLDAAQAATKAELIADTPPTDDTSTEEH